MGVFHAEGDGTLSGRLPIIYENGEISFDNGFLFSTPGSGGVVRIQNTEKVHSGMFYPELSLVRLRSPG